MTWYLWKTVGNSPQRVYREIITKIWATAEAEQVVQRKPKSCIVHLQSFLQNPCDPGSEGKTWLNMALEVLETNDVNKFVFPGNVWEILRKGTGETRNLIITGSSNCGKTFILNPLDTIFDTFTNPSSCKYAFVGVEKKKLMLLNDLRWTPEMIPWTDFLKEN